MHYGANIILNFVIACDSVC